jgi:type IV pilus assembly protein PilO
MAPTAQSVLARLPPAGKAGIGAGAVALVFFTYWFVFYSDVAAKIEGAHRQKTKLTDDFAAQQQAEATYLADRAELALREQRARDLNKVLPPDSQEDAFLSSLQQASNAAGIDLKGYSPQEERAETFYAKIPMRVELTGRFHQIAKFAYELGKSERVINVENIELTEPTAVGDEIILKARCLATAFHAIAPKPAAKGAP